MGCRKLLGMVTWVLGWQVLGNAWLFLSSVQWIPKLMAQAPHYGGEAQGLCLQLEPAWLKEVLGKRCISREQMAHLLCGQRRPEEQPAQIRSLSLAW